jgi:Protein of unknown function (DUF998)
VNQLLTATARDSTQVASVNDRFNWSLRLLACGVVAAPLFVGVVLIEAATRQGFDVVRMPLSLLSLGDAGWIQQANFIVAGLLFGASAIGMARYRFPGVGVWGARLVAMFAVGLIAAGLFSPDPALGFPPGSSPTIAPEIQSWHSQLHGVAFDIAFLSAIIACFMFARGLVSNRQAGWAASAVTTGAITPVLIVLGFANTTVMGLLFFAAGALTMTCLSAICWVSSRRQSPSQSASQPEGAIV